MISFFRTLFLIPEPSVLDRKPSVLDRKRDNLAEQLLELTDSERHQVLEELAETDFELYESWLCTPHDDYIERRKS